MQTQIIPSSSKQIFGSPNIGRKLVGHGGAVGMRIAHGIGRTFGKLTKGMASAGTFTACAALAWLNLAQISHAADDPKARETVDHVARLFISQASIATLEMHVVRNDWQRKIWMRIWSRGESHILVRISQPQEDAGTAILKVGNKAWQYLPKANRTVEMSGSMVMTSWMGGHFTLHDIVNQGRLTSDYVVTTSFEGRRGGVALSEFTLTPKPAAAVVWGKITLEVRQPDLMPLRQRYYDEDGKLIRELSFSDYKTVGGRLIPTRLVMRPLDQAHRNERTTITYYSLVFDPTLADDVFSLKNLKP